MGLAVFGLGAVVSDLSNIVNNTSLVAPEHSLNTFNAVPPAKSKVAAGGSIMADGAWVYVFGHFEQQLLNKTLYSSCQSMRNGCNGEKIEDKLGLSCAKLSKA